jgi:hypothetical protein
MKVRFVAEKGNKGDDNVTVVLQGIRNLPKYIMITAGDFSTPIGTGKVYVIDNNLKVESDLREQEFHLYPTIGFESILEEDVDGSIIVKESELHTVSLQPAPNNDPQIKTIMEQILEGSAELL